MSPWTILAGVMLLGGAFAGGYYEGHHQEQNVLTAKINAIKAADATALANSEATAIAKQNAQAQHFAVLQQTLEQDNAHAKAQYATDLAALKSGAERLRPEWSCTPVLAASVATATTGGSSNDANALLRDKDASAIVQLAANADAQIKYLQSVVASDRQQFSTGK